MTAWPLAAARSSLHDRKAGTLSTQRCHQHQLKLPLTRTDIKISQDLNLSDVAQAVVLQVQQKDEKSINKSISSWPTHAYGNSSTGLPLSCSHGRDPA